MKTESEIAVPSYVDMAITVLRDAKTPLHWRDMSSKARALGTRKRFSDATFHNILRTHPETFARVGRGTYGLIERGLKTLPPYPQIIASVLESAHKALEAEVVWKEVSAVRPIDHMQLKHMLNWYPRFYRSLDGTYGLRGWLITSDPNSPDTPRWRIEDPTSYKRVLFAQMRGYKVDEMARQDSLSTPQ